MALSSERLGITGKLDLLEEKGGATCPVESKRSAAPKDEAGNPSYWENDTIQVCAQGLLVEEHLGVEVPSGVLYYMGSKARVEVRLDESLRARTLQAIALIRELAARAVAPEPLPAELRHRCFGCSLAPICLPEETLYLIHPPEDAGPVAAGPAAEAEPEITPPTSAALTRVTASTDEKAVLYLHEPGSHVGRRSRHQVVTLQGQEINRVPIASIRQVVVFGNVQVSTQALHTLAEAEVGVSYMTGYGTFLASLLAPPAKNVALRAGQYRVFSDPERALGLARAVVAAKIANQRTLLMHSLRNRLAGFREGEAPSEPLPSSARRLRPSRIPPGSDGASPSRSPQNLGAHRRYRIECGDSNSSTHDLAPACHSRGSVPLDMGTTRGRGARFPGSLATNASAAAITAASIAGAP